MTTTAPHDVTDPPPVPPPLGRYGQVETDLVCDCGYNLHGQQVERDGRLGFMVCRCPECGRWHPAGHAVAGRSRWAGRVAVSIVAAWVLFVAAVLLAGTLVLLGMQFGHASMGVDYEYQLPDGRRIEYDSTAGNGQWVDKRTRQPVTMPGGGFTMVRVPRPLTAEETVGEVIMCGVVALVAAAMGGTIAVTAWHVPRWHHLWVAMLPLAAGAIVFTNLLAEARTNPDLHPMFPWLGWFVGLQVAAVVAGIFAGRPVARAFVRWVVPPGPRQAMAFLWRVDGKQLPDAPRPRIGAAERASHTSSESPVSADAPATAGTPPPAAQRVRVDCFCRCGRNLFGEAIARDAHTGVSICRCPDCGAAFAAGEGLDARALWLSRLGTAGLVAWVLLVLGGYAGALAVTAGLQAWAGDLIEYGFPSYRMAETVFCLLLAPSTALAIGVAMAVAHWHVPRLWYGVAAIALPLVATALIFLVRWADHGKLRDEEVLPLAFASLIQSALMFAGTAVGLAVARVLVRAIVPPSRRDRLAFLWGAGGRATG